MCDDLIIKELLQRIETSLQEIIEWTAHIKSASDFASSNEGMILLNAVYMKLFAVGEEVKSLDKHTNKALLPKYPMVQWKDIIGMRDVIAHHYFGLDADQVFDTLKEEVPVLLDVIRQIKQDLLRMSI